MRRAPTALAGLLLASLRVSSAAAQATELPPGGVLLDPSNGDVPRSEDLETARSVGTGIGLRAGVFGPSAVALNAANLPLGQQYHVEAFAGYAGREGGFQFGSVIADSSTGKLRAGFASRGIFGQGDRGYRGNEHLMALGMGVGDTIGIGLTGRYLRLKSRDDTSDGYPADPEARIVNLDASLRVTPTEGLHVAALGYNLVPTDSLFAPTRLGGSVVYQYETKLQVGVDTLADLTTFRSTTWLLGGGLEGWMRDKYAIRAGYRGDLGRGVHALTFGLAYVEPRFGVELSLRQELGPDRQSLLLFSARYTLADEPAN